MIPVIVVIAAAILLLKKSTVATTAPVRLLGGPSYAPDYSASPLASFDVSTAIIGDNGGKLNVNAVNPDTVTPEGAAAILGSGAGVLGVQPVSGGMDVIPQTQSTLNVGQATWNGQYQVQSLGTGEVVAFNGINLLPVGTVMIDPDGNRVVVTGRASLTAA